VFVDARGRRQERSPESSGVLPMHRDAMPGHDLSVTLDMELMRIIHNAFRGRRPGPRSWEVATGRVRALYPSRPTT
jgi:hypothetical protein